MLLAGCAGQQVGCNPVVRIDTVFVDLFSNKCPACRCPTIDASANCGPAVRISKMNAPQGGDPALWNSLDSMVRSDYDVKGGVMGAMVVRTRDTQVVWSRQPDLRMLPASTQKLWSNAAGLALLGPDFRWSTSLWMQGRVTGSVLRGNLYLEGGGDPTFGSTDGTGISMFVGALVKMRIKQVRGNLIAVDTMVGRGQEAWPQGWTISSSRDGYGAPVLGLNWNRNRFGDRALIEPRAEVNKAFRQALLEQNIVVTGTDTTVIARGDSGWSRRNWERIAQVSSPRLEDIARICLRESVNPFAEAIVLGMGMERSSLAPREAGRLQMREWATRQGFDPTKLVLDDGSGLSRYDLVTARQMSRLMVLDAQGRAGLRLIDLMARGGQGTLRRRFGEFPDRSVVIAKTGTLDGVVNLVGILMRPGRDTLSFAFLCSGFSGSAKPIRRIQDRMLAMLYGIPLTPFSPSDTVAAAEMLDVPEIDRPESILVPDESLLLGPGSTSAPINALPSTPAIPVAPPSRRDTSRAVDSTTASPFPEFVAPGMYVEPVAPVLADTAQAATKKVPTVDVFMIKNPDGSSNDAKSKKKRPKN